MTLVINEYHLFEGLSSSLIVSAADRNIINSSAADLSGAPAYTTPIEKRKLFEIPYLTAVISYFGIAALPTPNGYRSFWNLLPDFIDANQNLRTLHAFAFKLRDHLNANADRHRLKKFPSGFHLAGFSPEGYPDFFYISNIGKLERYAYRNFHDHYDARSQFLDGHARDCFQWDGKDPLTAQNGGFTYRNGDFKVHAVVWKRISRALNGLFELEESLVKDEILSQTNFRRPLKEDAYVDYVRARLRIIGVIYDELADIKYIGSKFDVIGLFKESAQSPVIRLGA